MAPGRTLEEVEGDFWGEPDKVEYPLVRRVHELRRKPLDRLTAEDLRLLIGQKVGLPTLLPRAVSLLKDHPLAEGDFYPGDLLLNVLRVPEEAWREVPAAREALRELLQGFDFEAAAEELSDGIRTKIGSEVRKFLTGS